MRPPSRSRDVVLRALLCCWIVLVSVPAFGRQTTQQAATSTAAAPQQIFGKFFGDFSPFIRPDGTHLQVQVTLLNSDMQVVGQSVSANFTENELRMFYTQPDSKSVPVWALVGTQSPGDHRFPFEATKPQGPDSSTMKFEEVIMGDFCLSDAPTPKASCTTGLLTVDPSTGIPVKKDKADPPLAQIRAYVQAADGTPDRAVLDSIGVKTARVSFTAPKSFKAAWLILEGTRGPHKFAWAPAPPEQISDLVYTADNLALICAGGAGKCVETAAKCVDLSACKLVLQPIASDATATFVALQNREKDVNDENDGQQMEEHLLVARVRAPMGLEPAAILVTNQETHTSVIVRRTLKSNGNDNILNVHLSIMDQATVQRNFGQRIAKRYLAVSLDVRNPTAKKLQFNKGALYFDVDYVEAKGQSGWSGFRYSVETFATLGMREYNPYEEAEFNKAEHPRLFRFGLEQNVQQSSVNYLSALGSFDATTEKTGQEFDTIQLLASIMTTIATGGVAGSGQFRSSSALLSGVFLPGLKGIILNDSHINRLRANLVVQTLQEVITVPSNQPVTTIVLLPRNGILAFHDAEIPVLIDRILDVHIVPEVVTEVTGTPVEKNQCKVGYTREQARQALGEPAGVTTNADGTSVFTYPTGAVSSASFDAKGELVSCQQRSNSDQFAQAKTLIEFNETATRLGLNVNRITLTDGSIVAVDIPGVQQTYHFDSKGNKATDYTFLFSQIKTYEKGTKEALETFLQKSGTALSNPRATELKMSIEGEKKALKAGDTIRYPSPDIDKGTIVVTMKDATTIDTITFEGDKPASLK